jgi:hypothetical protein
MRPRSDKSGDAVGRPSCRSSLLGDPGAKFLVETGDPNRTMKNSLNYVSTCLSVVDTRRFRLFRALIGKRLVSLAELTGKRSRRESTGARETVAVKHT